MTQADHRHRVDKPNGSGADFAFWRDHTTITLRPAAAPSILGLYGFAVSTFLVAANLAGWYGNDTTTPLILFPFAFAFGGSAQLLAAMWTYRARAALTWVGFVTSAVLAGYTASAMLPQAATQRVVLPMGTRGRPPAPGAIPTQPIQYEAGEPGMRIGQ